MKVALVQCPAFGIDKPPLALGYLEAFLKENTVEVKSFDFNVDLYSQVEDKKKDLWEFQHVFQWVDKKHFADDTLIPAGFFEVWTKQIESFAPDLIGFSIQSSSLEVSIKLAGRIKDLLPKVTIVFGGPLHLSYSIEHAYYLLQIKNANNYNIVDVIVLGEGENTLLALVKTREAGKSIENCPGTIVRSGETFLNNGLAPHIKDLDELPFPVFDTSRGKYKYKDRLPILGSRGCVNRCSFCDDTLMWQKYRCRSAENIVKEMQLRVDQGIEFLEFNDLLINGNYRQLSLLCDLLIKNKVRITWGGSACVDKRLDRRLLKKMRKAGCCYLNYGVESASPKILKEMNKDFTVNEARGVIKSTYKAGISACTNWIVGFPTETREDYQKTYDFIEKNIKYLKNNIMVNSFIVKHTSSLFKNKDYFGIVMEDNHSWHSQGGANTVKERKKKFDQLLGLINRLGDSPAHKTFQK